VRIAQRQHLRIEIEIRIDLIEWLKEPAFVELDIRRTVDVDEVERAGSAATYRRTGFFEHAVEGRNFEVHSVSGLLLVKIHDVLEPGIPRRRVYQDGDRLLLADVQKRLLRARGADADGDGNSRHRGCIMHSVHPILPEDGGLRIRDVDRSQSVASRTRHVLPNDGAGKSIIIHDRCGK
jgi:hypothetical protein